MTETLEKNIVEMRIVLQKESDNIARMIQDLMRQLPDILDLSVFAKAFASRAGHYRWNWNVNIDGNQVVDIADAARVTNDFGKQQLVQLQTIEGEL